MAVYFDSFGTKYIAQEVLNKIRDKLIIHNIFRIQWYYVWILFCSFYRIYALRKRFVRLEQLKINTIEEASLQFRLRKIDETRNYLLDEINHNDLISEKHKNTCKHKTCFSKKYADVEVVL